MKCEVTAKRLTAAMANAGIKAIELSERSGISKSSISQYVKGSHAPSNISAGKMAAVLGVSPVWLMGFDVPMLPETVEEDLIRKYRALSAYDRGKVDQFIDDLLGKKEAGEMEGDVNAS